MQTDDVTPKKPCEICDFFHLLESRRAGLGWHQADGAFDRRDIRIALAIESSEDTSQFDPVLIEFLKEGFGRRGSSSRGMRCVKLDRRDTQFPGDLQMNSEPRINTCKNAYGPRC